MLSETTPAAFSEEQWKVVKARLEENAEDGKDSDMNHDLSNAAIKTLQG